MEFDKSDLDANQQEHAEQFLGKGDWYPVPSPEEGVYLYAFRPRNKWFRVVVNTKEGYWAFRDPDRDVGGSGEDLREAWENFLRWHGHEG